VCGALDRLGIPFLHRLLERGESDRTIFYESLEECFHHLLDASVEEVSTKALQIDVERRRGTRGQCL
jgi:hypothetical protein